MPICGRRELADDVSSPSANVDSVDVDAGKSEMCMHNTMCGPTSAWIIARVRAPTPDRYRAHTVVHTQTWLLLCPHTQLLATLAQRMQYFGHLLRVYAARVRDVLLTSSNKTRDYL